MVAPSSCLHLLTPGLIGELSPSEADAAGLTNLPTVERVLARADRRAAAGHHLREQLFEGFQVPAHCGVAPLTYLADRGRAGDGCWLRADPVYLRADQDRLVLFTGEALHLDAEEASALCRSLDEHFRDRGWRFEAPTPQRWYLNVQHSPQVRTVPVDEVVGHDINTRLPEGAEGGHWRAALNEAQMLLHVSPINEARVARGELPVNSIWLWGEGAMPEPLSAPWASVCSDEPLARGLALRAGVTAQGAPADFASWAQIAGGGDHLVVLSMLQRHHGAGDLTAWREALAALERDWLTPAVAALRGGRMRALHWWPGGQWTYDLNRRRWRRFWRRRQAVPVAAPSKDFR